MAKVVIITFRCPKCRLDIGRQFGLITTTTIVCSKCGTHVRLDSAAVAQNWGFNFGWMSALLIWFALGVGVLVDPQFAATMGNTTFPAATDAQRVVIALTCGIWAFLAGLCFAMVGMVLGSLVATFAPAGSAPMETDLPDRPTAGPPQTRERGCLVRMIFIFVWPVVGFFVAVIAITAVATIEAGNDPVMQQIAIEEAGKQTAPWLVFGTLAVFLLSCVGLLPFTGRKRKR